MGIWFLCSCRRACHACSLAVEALGIHVGLRRFVPQRLTRMMEQWVVGLDRVPGECDCSFNEGMSELMHVVIIGDRV